jgi:hypothetical protein
VTRLRTGLLFAGLALQVVVWFLVIPPFLNYDEFDHAYRASAVAHGQIVAPPSAATRGTGALVAADRSIVEAAGPECTGLPYTTEEDCSPGVALPGGLTQVPSGAGRYSPVYYLLTGWATLTAHGTAALVAARAVSAALCLVVLGVAVLLARRWRASESGMIGLVLACSPMLLYSLAILAPNGLEMAAGLLAVASLVALVDVGSRGTVRRREVRTLWLLLAPAVLLLATLRPLGPLWLGLAAAAFLIWRPTAIRRAFSAAPWAAAPAVGAGLTGSLGAATWTLSQRSLTLGMEPSTPDVGFLEGFALAARMLPVHLLQMIAAIPWRNQAPPSLTLAGWLVPFVLLLGLGLKLADRRGRLALALLITAALVIPIVAEGATVARFGLAWQGRYLLPAGVALPVLASLMAAPGHTGRRARMNLWITAVATGAAQVNVVLFALHNFAGRSASYTAGTWPVVPDGVLVAGTVVGTVLVGAALLSGRRPDTLAPASGSAEASDVAPTAPADRTDATATAQGGRP